MKPFFMFFFHDHEKEEKPTLTRILPVIKQKIRQGKKIDFRFKKREITEKLTAGIRTKNNLLAIKTLKEIEAEERLATRNEQEILSKYSGWGGQSEIFNLDNPNYNSLKEMLSENEYIAARNTVTDAFFTDPQIADEIYKTIRRFGFKKGNILEPSLGAGVFFSVMQPCDDIKRYGVEIDSITGRIAKQLYQTADISICGIEKSRFEDNFFDVVIGNIPFGDYKIPDRKYDKYHFLIHDYFIAKVIDLVRPGGVIALITSKGTMDKKNSKVRKYFAKRADLIGAVRLPNSAFRACAGTDVTSDILFLQKKKQPLESPAIWTETTELYNGIYVNRYFAENPDMILGEMKYDHRFGDSKFTYCENNDFSIEELHDALKKLDAKIEIVTEDTAVNDVIPADPDVKNYT